MNEEDIKARAVLCEATTKVRQWLSFGDPPVVVKCTKEDGHEGLHVGYAQPFPGFANEAVRWDDGQSDLPVGHVPEVEER